MYKSIRLEQIAKATIATAQHHPAASATVHHSERMALIASGQQESSASQESSPSWNIDRRTSLGE
jgi:hypothetical protein